MHEVVLDSTVVSWGPRAIVLDVPFRGGIMELALVQKSMIPTKQPRQASSVAAASSFASSAFKSAFAASEIKAKIEGCVVGKAFVDVRELKFGEAKCLEIPLQSNSKDPVVVGMLKAEAELIPM